MSECFSFCAQAKYIITMTTTMTTMVDERKYMALAIVWNHWTKEEIQVKKQAWQRRSREVVETQILRQLHVQNLQMFTRLWNQGIDFIQDQFLLDVIIELALTVQENRIVYGTCIYCPNVTRIQVHDEGIFITCSGEECHRWGTHEEPLILL